jgi:mannitol/fructose-specific phosphotransferase system IIA component
MFGLSCVGSPKKATDVRRFSSTHGIVHAGFSGLQEFVARKKSRCKLIGNRLVIPHDTIP